MNANVQRRGPTTPSPSSASSAAALLTEAQRRALLAELDREFWQRVRGQCRQRPWPGRLQSWDVSPEGRVLAGVITGRALVWLDAGPAPVPDPQDPRLQALLKDREQRQALWRQVRREGRGAGRPDAPRARLPGR
jgi:hypothetical protein